MDELTSIRTLQLTVASIEGNDEENDNTQRTEPPVQAGPSAIDHPTEIDAPAEARKSQPPPPPPDSGAGSAVPADTVVAETGVPEPAQIVTTSAISEHSTPAAEALTNLPKPTVVVSIPADQQHDIARKVLQWAQGLNARQTEIEDASSQLSWNQDGREYTAVLKRQPAGSSSEHDGASVEISTTENGRPLRTNLQLRRLAFSHFTQLVDEWDSDVQLHDDEVIGRFHSNSRLAIGLLRATPRFRGKVTSAAHDYAIGNRSLFRPRSEIFQGGFELGAGRITLPRQFVQLGSSAAMGDARIQFFERDTRIAFYSDGTYGWQLLKRGAVEVRDEIGSDPLLIVGGRGVELRVRGVVKGTVLVYSRARIWVDDDLTYATNPRLVPDSQDYTGLVSDKFIDIAGPGSTGPGDLHIDAALYARRSFTVRDEQARGRTHATLRIYGSLTAGTLSATEPRYATHLEFDPRFERKRPPGFPMTNRYEVERWDGQWLAPD